MDTLDSQQNLYPGLQISVPNSTAVLVLGILSIVMCWCWGIIGLIMGIIALVLASKGNTEYQANPQAYTQSSYKNLHAGKICAIIGTSLSGAYFVFWIIYFSIVGTMFGTAFSMYPWHK